MRQALLFCLIAVTSALRSQETVVADPIADFLALPVEGRYTEASVLNRIYRVTVDIDLDGQPETLIGAPMMWVGDNNGVYWSFYKKTSSGYLRITRPEESVRLQMFGGDPRFLYVGQVDEVGSTGLLQCDPIVTRGDPEDGGQQINIIRSQTFVGMKERRLIVKENLPGLDLRKPEDKTVYDKYFGKPGKQGGFKAESISISQLEQMGYEVPSWKTPPKPVNATPTPQPPLQPSNSTTQQPSPPATKPNTPQPKPPVMNQQDPAMSRGWLVWLVVVMMATGGAIWLFLRKSSK